jgi:mannose-6-phosphate isomerase-like protein (cupin superfamily)
MTQGTRLMTDNIWQVFDLEEIKGKLKGEAVEYLEFLNVPALNCGIYFLAAGSTDMQAPHDEDEVYVVLQGKARMRLDDADRAIVPGSLLYISASTEHSFFEIEEDMTLLVMFAASPLVHS